MTLTPASLFEFIAACPTPYHTAAAVSARLEAAGYAFLPEEAPWDLTPGEKYYTTRGGASVLAFRAPAPGEFEGFTILSPHGDSPCFLVKGSPEMRVEGRYTKLNTEVYGGTILSRWLDRPLSVAGVLTLREGDALRTVLTDIPRDLLMIPSLAIHMDREANQGRKLDPQKDTLPLLSLGEAKVLDLAAEAAGVDPAAVLAYDLRLYARQQGTLYGAENEFMAAPRLDDLECVFAAVEAFLAADVPASRCPVLALFDKEEVGSLAPHAADSTFLADGLGRVLRSTRKSSCYSAGADEEGRLRALRRSFMLSADNAHAVHPNYPEKADPTNRCYLGGGVVLKHGARYATDARSAGLFRLVCQKAGVPVQEFYNHSAIPGGGTLGQISGRQVSIPTADIGAAQLAMHSPVETAAAADLSHLGSAMKAVLEDPLR